MNMNPKNCATQTLALAFLLVLGLRLSGADSPIAVDMQQLRERLRFVRGVHELRSDTEMRALIAKIAGHLQTLKAPQERLKEKGLSPESVRIVEVTENVSRQAILSSNILFCVSRASVSSGSNWSADLNLVELRLDKDAAIAVLLSVVLRDAGREMVGKLPLEQITGHELSSLLEVRPILLPGLVVAQNEAIWPLVVGPTGSGRFVSVYAVWLKSGSLRLIPLEQEGAVRSWTYDSSKRSVVLKLSNRENILVPAFRDYYLLQTAANSIAPVEMRQNPSGK